MNGNTAIRMYRNFDILARYLETILGSRVGDLKAYVVLQLIEDGADEPTKVAEAMGHATPTISHILSRLETQGFITRHKAHRDGRVRKLELTDDGELHLLSAYQELDGVVYEAAFLPTLRKGVQKAADRVL